MKVAKAYCRVSTQKQVDDHASLFVQQKKIEQYCQYKQFNLAKVYEDKGISGKDMNRPQFKLMIDELNEGDTIIVADLSRFSRNLKDTIGMFVKLDKLGVNFVSLDPELDFGSAYGRAFISFIQILNQLEQERVSKQVSEAMRILKEEGKLRTRPPFGYKFVGKKEDFAPIPEQLEVVEKIKQLHSEKTNLSQIVRTLNDDGDNKVLLLSRKTHTDKVPLFYPQTVKRILIAHGVIEDKTGGRNPVEQRILSRYTMDARDAARTIKFEEVASA